MGTEDEDLLADEGVNEGSKDSTAESPRGSGVTGALDAATSSSAPTSESDPAPPDDLETDASRHVRDASPGQQLEAGEG